MQIKMLVMDVDGTLTDGRIYMTADGELIKAFNIKDGLGIHELLPKAGIIPVVITGRESKIVENRCRELGISHCYQGCRNKEEKLIELAGRMDLRADQNGIYREIAYIGDDVNDLPCMKRCAMIGCPADAAAEIKKIAQFVSSRNGGHGAVREFIEWLTGGIEDGQEEH